MLSGVSLFARTAAEYNITVRVSVRVRRRPACRAIDTSAPIFDTQPSGVRRSIASSYIIKYQGERLRALHDGVRAASVEIASVR